jgi:8-oxo-dGTP diphosphatase
VSIRSYGIGRGVLRKYVCGFMFCGTHVALIRKTKPDWQRGLWNGVGGKVEDGEGLRPAMIREFKEETGYDHADWKPFQVLQGVDDAGHWMVWFYKTRVLPRPTLRTMTEEQVDWVYLDWISKGETKVVPNLRWLIPMALYGNDISPTMLTYNPDRKGDY